MSKLRKCKVTEKNITLKNGSYFVRKKFNGKEKSKSFSNLRDAKYWRDNYHPILNPSPSRSNPFKQKALIKNGSDIEITIQEAFEKYKAIGIIKVVGKTKANKIGRIGRFISDFSDMKLCDLTPETLAVITTNKAEQEKKLQINPQRNSFDRDLRELSTMFNWYQEMIDYTFTNPVKRHHLEMSVIKEPTKPGRKMTAKEFLLFKQSFTEKQKLYCDIATVQFHTASRIAEVLGITRDMVDLKNRVLHIRKITEYTGSGGRRPVIVERTKNESPKDVYITDDMFEVIARWLNSPKADQNALFHVNGKIVRYNPVGENYNKAFKRAGLPYRGTHTLRKGMTNTTRKLLGLEHAQSIASHKSRKTTETIYTDLNEQAVSLNKESAIAIENHLRLISG